MCARLRMKWQFSTLEFSDTWRKYWFDYQNLISFNEFRSTVLETETRNSLDVSTVLIFWVRRQTGTHTPHICTRSYRRDLWLACRRDFTRLLRDLAFCIPFVSSDWKLGEILYVTMWIVSAASHGLQMKRERIGKEFVCDVDRRCRRWEDIENIRSKEEEPKQKEGEDEKI